MKFRFWIFDIFCNQNIGCGFQVKLRPVNSSYFPTPKTKKSCAKYVTVFFTSAEFDKIYSARNVVKVPKRRKFYKTKKNELLKKLELSRSKIRALSKKFSTSITRAPC